MYNLFSVDGCKICCTVLTQRVSVYDTVEPYLVSDLPVNSLQSMLKRYEGYEIAEILSLEGETVLGEEFYEFHPDAEKLEELTMRLFYAPK